MTPSEQARWKKDHHQIMTKIEKVLYLRSIYGWGLRESIDWLEKTKNDFDGYWQEEKSE